MEEMNIKRVIKEKGYTIPQLADKMGKNRVTLFQTISGNPTVKTLKEIAEAIGCKVGDFFREDDDFVAFVRKEGVTHTFRAEDELRRWLGSEDSL